MQKQRGIHKKVFHLTNFYKSYTVLFLKKVCQMKSFLVDSSLLLHLLAP